MFKIGDYVIYKRDVCKIKNTKTSKINNKEYYVLVPIDDKSLIINVPMENINDNIKKIISKTEALNLIDHIKDIDIIKNVPDKMLESEYKKLLTSGEREDLIRIIKTTYLRNQNRINDKKKIGEKDNNYFNLAEKKLYNELSVALNMSYDEIKEYIFNNV